MRKQHPDVFSPSSSDEYIYKTAKRAFPNIDVESWDEVDRIQPPKADISPDGWNELIFKDINDDSWEWVKHAYANSLQGTLEAWKNGSLDYDINKDYDELNVGEKILSGVASFLMPLDIMTLMGGGIVSRGIMAGGKKLAGKQLSNSLAGRGFLSKLDAVGTKYGLGEGVAKKAIERAIVEGNTLGLYEAAKGGLHADNTGGDVSKAIADGYVHGSLMGAVFGGTGGVLEGNFLKYKALKEMQAQGGFKALGLKSGIGSGFKKPYTIPELEKMMKYTGAIPQYAAEVAALEAFTIADAAMNSELKGEKLLEDLVVNIGFAGLMRGKRKVLNELGNKYRESRSNYEEDFHVRRLEELRKSRGEELYSDTRPWQERLQDQGLEGLRKVKEEARKNNDTKLEEIVDEGIQQFNENAEPIRFKENEAIKKLINFDELDKQLIYLEEALKEDMSAKTAKERVKLLKDVNVNIDRIHGALGELISSGHVSEKVAGQTRAFLSQKAMEEQALTKKYIHKTNDADVTFLEKQTTARTLFADTQNKLKNLAEKPSKKILDKIIQKEETFESLIKTDEGVDSYIAGTRNALRMLQGKEGAEGRDVSLKQVDYNVAKETLKRIESGEDTTTPGSVIANKALKGKFKSGTKYFEGVEDFAKVAFQDYTASESSKQLKQYAPFVAKFLHGTKRRPLDELTMVEIQHYIRERIIENKGKPLGSTELSAISRFTKHISSGKGRFNKNIEWGIGTDSIFKATNKKLAEGTHPAIPGIRRHVIDIGEKLSSKTGDDGYRIAS
jgi:hypothetical protein